MVINKLKFDKMRNLNKYIIIIVLSLLPLACSDDFISFEPMDSLSNETALNTYDKLTKGVHGLYSPFQSRNYYGLSFVVTPDIMADNLKRTTKSDGSSRYITEYNLKITPKDSHTGTWSLLYYIITASCNVIDRIENSNFDKQGNSDASVNQLLGEALFVRGLCHFDLVRMFAPHYTMSDAALINGSDGAGGHLGVPIILKTEMGKPARNTVKEVYDQIIDDLTRAETLITLEKGKNYASVNAVKALLSRVYLYKEDWVNAAKYADEVIAAGLATLVDKDHYEAYWIADDGDETIFQVRADKQDSYFPGGSENLGSLFVGTYKDLVPTDNIHSLYSNEDVRKKLFIVDSKGEIRAYKYAGRDGENDVELNNTKVLRISEMFLTSAEANYRRTDADKKTLAKDRLNELRENRGLSELSSITLNDILTERRKELAFEGHRLYDLARNKANIVRPENLPTPLVTYPSKYYAMPVPESEVNRNENISKEDNNGY